MKKLLFICAFFTIALAFAQENVYSVANTKEKQIETIESVSAYPNPFSNVTKINFKSVKDQTIEFTVKNLVGKAVYSEKINAKEGYNSIPFNRNDLPQGMYIYSLQTETELVSKRLVIR
jgi:hypothetical protein